MVSRNEILEKLAEFFPGGGYDERWVAFSKIIARTAVAKEREACAKVCEDMLTVEGYERNIGLLGAAVAIRKRGQA